MVNGRYLATHRRNAERDMRDTVTIERAIPGAEPDPLNGHPAMDLIYTGKARVQTYEPQESTPEAGGHVYTVQRYSVHIPVGSCAPEVGDIVTVTTAEMDPHLVGRQYTVRALLHKTAATAYRLGVEEDPA